MKFSKEDFETAKNFCKSLVKDGVTDEHIKTLSKTSGEVIRLVFMHMGEEPTLQKSREDMGDEPLFTVFTDNASA